MTYIGRSFDEWQKENEKRTALDVYDRLLPEQKALLEMLIRQIAITKNVSEAAHEFAVSLKNDGLDREDVDYILSHVMAARLAEEHGRTYTITGIKGLLDKLFPVEKSDLAGELIELLDKEKADYWHDSEGTLFVTHDRRHVELKGSTADSFLGGLFYSKLKKTIHTGAVRSALNVLKYKAGEGAEYRRPSRIAVHDGVLYVNCGQGKFIAIEPGTWHEVDTIPSIVKFRLDVKSLPVPVRGYHIDECREDFNMSDSQFTLMKASWVNMYNPGLDALHSTGTYPITVFTGPPNSAKTFACRQMMAVVEPREVRRLPSTWETFVIDMTKHHVVCYDNIDHLVPWMTDLFCSASTGSEAAARELYTNAEERVFKIRLPILLNGIGDIASANDLLDRSVILSLDKITKMRAESDVIDSFTRKSGAVLGSLLDAACVSWQFAQGLALPSASPRAGDFLKWVLACSDVLGLDGFYELYLENRQRGHEIAINASPVGKWIVELANNGGFTGTAQELFEKMTDDSFNNQIPFYARPKTASLLSSQLTRLSPNLLAMGIEVTSVEALKDFKVWMISRVR